MVTNILSDLKKQFGLFLDLLPVSHAKALIIILIVPLGCSPSNWYHICLQGLEELLCDIVLAQAIFKGQIEFVLLEQGCFRLFGKAPAFAAAFAIDVNG